jgi:hypothetical protein
MDADPLVVGSASFVEQTQSNTGETGNKPKSTMPLRKSAPTPRAMVDCDARAASIMDQDAIGRGARIVADQTVWTVMANWMFGANFIHRLGHSGAATNEFCVNQASVPGIA